MSRIEADERNAELADMVRSRDILGLRRSFRESVDWHTGKEVITAFGVLC